MAEQTSAERFEAYWREQGEPVFKEGMLSRDGKAFPVNVARAAWDARQPEIDRLRAEVQAGKELYWALQGGLERCPWCESGSLQHTTECPVSQYLTVVSPAYREALDG